MSFLSNPYNCQYGKLPLFYGREKIAENIIEHLIRRNSSFGICGGSFMGKTTLLRYIEHELFIRTIQEFKGGILLFPVYIDSHRFNPIRNIGEAYQLLISQLKSRFERKNSFHDYNKINNDFNGFRDYLQFIINSQTSPRFQIIFLFDDIQLIMNLEWSFDFFANWNYLLTKNPPLSLSLNAVFAGSSELYKITKDISSPLSNILKWIELEPFSVRDTADLIREPSQYDWTDEFIQSIYSITGGHPYLIQHIMEIICNQEIIDFHQAVKMAKFKFIENRKTTFQNWWNNFDAITKAIYTSIARQGSLKREVIFAEFGHSAQQGLDILAHTGVIKIDLNSNKAEIAGTLFKEWHEKAGYLINNFNKSSEIILDGKNEKSKKKIFICYAKEDYTTAERLYDDLTDKGIECWLDRKSLLPGQNWKEENIRSIRESDYFLLLISCHSVTNNGHIQKEQKYALEKLDEFPNNKTFIVPARLDDTMLLSETLLNLCWADLSSSYEKGLQQILQVFFRNIE